MSWKDSLLIVPLKDSLRAFMGGHFYCNKCIVATHFLVAEVQMYSTKTTLVLQG